MLTTTTDRPEVRVSDFSDRLRVVAMLGVVAIHCALPVRPPDSSIWYDQVGKFADGLFLFVSGYLWQVRGGSSRPGHYLLDRVRNLAPPYLLWAALTGGVVSAWWIAAPGTSFSLVDVARTVMTSTAMWFIPQLLLSLIVTSWLWRLGGALASGAVLVAVSVLYGVNLHTGWVPLHHTEAPLGFASFVWLGFVVHAHEARVRALLGRPDPATWVLALVATYVAGAVEATRLGSGDSLRLANLAYTVVAIGAALALCYGRGVTYREPPEERGRVYGVYLVHTCVVMVVVGLVAYAAPASWQQSMLPWWANVAGRLVLLALVWRLTSAVIRRFRDQGASRWVGAPARPRAREHAAV